MSKSVGKYLQNYLRNTRSIPEPELSPTISNHLFLKRIQEKIASPASRITVHTPEPIPQDYYKMITAEVRNVIEASPGYYSRQYQFELPKRQRIKIDCIYPYFEEAGEVDPNPAKMDEMFMECVHQIYKWLFVANEYRKQGCSETLHIWLYMTHAPKLIDVPIGGGQKRSLVTSNRKPLDQAVAKLNQAVANRMPLDQAVANRKPLDQAVANRKPLGETNANTAFTYPCRQEGNIFIYREEEWFKVLIHETFHSYSLDFCSNDALAILAQNNIQNKFLRVKNKELRIFETYCETMAEMLNLIFSYKNINANLHVERQFSIFQMVKVLRYMGLSYKDLFQLGEYKEDTYIFSYYVLKCICLYYINEFLDWRMGEPSLLAIEHTDESIIKFTQFIIERASRPEFVADVERMENWWERHPPGEKIEDLTMRMTVFG